MRRNTAALFVYRTIGATEHASSVFKELLSISQTVLDTQPLYRLHKRNLHTNRYGTEADFRSARWPCLLLGTGKEQISSDTTAFVGLSCIRTASTQRSDHSLVKVKNLVQSMKGMIRRHENEQAVELFDSSGSLLASCAAKNPYSVADAYDFALQAYAATGDARKAEKLVSTMWKSNIPVGRVANSSVVKALCAAGRRGDALKYIKSISAQRSSIVGYNILLNECVESKDYDVGLKAWNVVRKKGCTPDAITWSAVVRLHGRPGMRQSLYTLWKEWLDVSKGFSEADVTSIGASYVSALCAAQDYEEAFRECERLLEAISAHLPVELNISETAHHTSYDGRYEHQGDDQKKEKSKAHMHASSVDNVRVACNTLLHASVASSHDGNMDALIKTMTSKGLTPDTATYNALLRRSLRRREGSLAIKEGLGEMQRIGLLPDQTSIEILIQSYALQGQIKEAENAVDVIIQEFGCPPCHAWGTLMTACGKAGDVEHVSHVFHRSIEYLSLHDADDASFHAIVVTCLQSLYHALGKDFWRRTLHKGQAKHAPEDHFHYIEDIGTSLLEDIDTIVDSHGMRNNHKVWINRLKCLGALGRTESVDACMRDLKAESIDHCRTLEDYLAILGRPQSSRRQQRQHNANRKLVLSQEDYSNLLQVVARLGRIDDCFDLISHMKNSGIRLSAKDYVSLMEACAQCSPPMEELSRQLLRHARESANITIDTRFYNALILVKARLYGVQGVHEGMDEMIMRGIQPNVFTYFVLRETALMSNDKRTATSTWQTIQNLVQGHEHGPSHHRKDDDAEEVAAVNDKGSMMHTLFEDPESTHQKEHHHWKGYYASDDDEW
ncbi:hypothetical protein M9434_006749 [Picochlorum sp. BPE23]|nr:hypothetical protein M9434_006749 [Picochlorum sp. BPE23]